MKLLLSQKSTLFDLIEQDEYFSPLQFEIVETPNSKGNILTHLKYKDSEYFFKFIQTDNHNELFYCNYSPGETSVLGISDNTLWRHSLNFFKNWLSFLKRELVISNKWDRIFSSSENLSFISLFDKSKFTYSEYQEVKDKINQIQSSLKSIPLLENQQTVINKKLDDLLETAKDLSKYDWKNLFIGTIISIIIQLEVNKDNANQLWQLIKRIFSNYLLL